MIDRTLCMATRDGEALSLFGALCQEPATHETLFGRHCAHHAERLRVALRNPNSIGNIFTGQARGRTEEEIACLIKELP